MSFFYYFNNTSKNKSNCKKKNIGDNILNNITVSKEKDINKDLEGKR